MQTLDFYDLGTPVGFANFFLNIFNLIAVLWLMTHITVRATKHRKSERKDTRDEV